MARSARFSISSAILAGAFSAPTRSSLIQTSWPGPQCTISSLPSTQHGGQGRALSRMRCVPSAGCLGAKAQTASTRNSAENGAAIIASSESRFPRAPMLVETPPRPGLFPAPKTQPPNSRPPLAGNYPLPAHHRIMLPTQPSRPVLLSDAPTPSRKHCCVTVQARPLAAVLPAGVSHKAHRKPCLIRHSLRVIHPVFAQPPLRSHPRNLVNH